MTTCESPFSTTDILKKSTHESQPRKNRSKDHSGVAPSIESKTELIEIDGSAPPCCKVIDVLKNFDPEHRTPREKAQWARTMLDSSRAALIRATRLHFQLHSSIGPSLRLCQSRLASRESAVRVPAYGMRKHDRPPENELSLQREFVVDTGAFQHFVRLISSHRRRKRVSERYLF